jgi:hypothetical protein
MSETATVTNNTGALAPQSPSASNLPAPPRIPAPPVKIGERGLILTSIEDLWRFAQYASKSGLAPKGIETPEAIFIAVQLGLEIGLTPMASLQNIGVINGRPGIYGDAALAVVRGSGLLTEFREWYEVGDKKLTNSEGHSRTPTAKELENDSCTAYTLAKRIDHDATVYGFSVGDAKLAGLNGKAGPWTQYKARMLKWRARGFCLRDAFPDVLKGIRSTDELQDMEPLPAPSDGAPPVGRARVLTPKQIEKVEAPVTKTENWQPVEEKDPEPTPDEKPPTSQDNEAEQAALTEFLDAIKNELAACKTPGDIEAGPGKDVQKEKEWLMAAGKYDGAGGALEMVQERFRELMAKPAAEKNEPKSGKKSSMF